MTRRTFVELGAIAGGFAALSGLAGCGSTSQASPASSAASSFAESAESVESASSSSASSSSASSAPASSEAPQVYFTRALDSAGLQAVFAAIGRELGSGKIGVKLSSGEPGGNHYLKGDLIADLVHAVGGTIVECNTAYGGGRSSIAAHYQVAADHGFNAIADFQIMDEAGSLSLPVVGGLHLSEDLVGAAFSDYDGFLVLSHFKGHMMAGFGGALKNISIGMASREGKYLIHSAGATSESWRSAATPDFLESIADACKAVLAAQPNMLFVNVMNNLSVDCDCDSNPAPPKMADIGILASADPVALDQACVDLVYASEDDSADLIKRMESRDGVHVLEVAESLGVGSRAYELVEIG
ncbi:MAG: ferredoxin [Coriobacteriia bacterium]|nr:MAG: ferredoxin [Coriobacteriia bacterium]